MSLPSLSYLLFPTLVRGSPATSAKDRWDYSLFVIVGKNLVWIAIVVSNAVCVKDPTCLMSTPSQFVFFEQHTCGLWGEHTETCDSNTEYCTLVMRQQVNLKLTKTKAGIKTKAEEKDNYKDKDKYQDKDSNKDTWRRGTQTQSISPSVMRQEVSIKQTGQTQWQRVRKVKSWNNWNIKHVFPPLGVCVIFSFPEWLQLHVHGHRSTDVGPTLAKRVCDLCRGPRWPCLWFLTISFYFTLNCFCMLCDTHSLDIYMQIISRQPLSKWPCLSRGE